MWEVFVWVPAKGWKRIMGTRSQRKAIDRALEFVPLEVKLVRADGAAWYSGQACMPAEGHFPLLQIEGLRDSLVVPV